MRPLNQCAQCAHGASESVVPMAVVAGDVVVFGGVERIGVIVPRSTSPCGFSESVVPNRAILATPTRSGASNLDAIINEGTLTIGWVRTKLTNHMTGL